MVQNMSAGRPKNPPKPLEAWYTVLARAWGTYAFTQSEPSHIEQPKTVWRQNDLALSPTPHAGAS